MTARSNFNSATNNSAWFITVGADGRAVTRKGNGRTVVAMLQRAIKSRLTSPHPTCNAEDGTVTGSIITSVDGKWGARTSKGLCALMHSMNISSDRIVDDIRSNTITFDVLQAALVALFPNDEIHIPGDVIPPVFNSSPGGSIGTSLTSSASTNDEKAAAGIRSGGEPQQGGGGGGGGGSKGGGGKPKGWQQPSGQDQDAWQSPRQDQQQQQQQQDQSSGQPLVGRVTPADQQPQATDQSSGNDQAVQEHPARSIPWVPIAIGAGVLVVGAAVIFMSMGKGGSRANPTPRRKHRRHGRRR